VAAEDWLDPDRAYWNGAFIPGAEAFPLRWAEAAAVFRAGLGGRARLDLAYGADERQKFDLFLPEGAPRGLLVFVHGGYWMAFGRKDWSHFAGGALARGWACVLPSYRLAPEVRVAEMTRDVAAAVAAARALVPRPVVVTGHSAGGHLSARMGCEDGPAGVVRVVPISPLAELAPLMATEMQGKLRLDAAEVAAESPARLALKPGVQAQVWVGGAERPAFLWQARVLAEAWECPWLVEPGKHHFDVIDGLLQRGSALMEACLGGL
jgi:acetyl esterase/lipase